MLLHVVSYLPLALLKDILDHLVYFFPQVLELDIKDMRHRLVEHVYFVVDVRNLVMQF